MIEIRNTPHTSISVKPLLYDYITIYIQFPSSLGTAPIYLNINMHAANDSTKVGCSSDQWTFGKRYYNIHEASPEAAKSRRAWLFAITNLSLQFDVTTPVTTTAFAHRLLRSVSFGARQTFLYSSATKQNRLLMSCRLWKIWGPRSQISRL